jgi:DNA (cytosine-5)-methyltransferase 1
MKYKKISDTAALREQAGLTIEQVADLTGATTRTVYRWENGYTRPNKLVIGILKDQAERYAKSTGTSNFTFIDLFAGIGGMRLAFESVGGKCVYTSEWDSHAVKTYLANFSTTHKIDGDIRIVEPQSIPEHNVLVAGFPCQPFSIAGVSKKNALGKPHGFRDKTQGTLFFKIAEILEYHRPDAFLLENVKNLKTHDRGKTFNVICETLDELGYAFDFRVIDARAFVPQHRERIFIVGFKKDRGFSFADLRIEHQGTSPTLSSILHPEDGTESLMPPYTEAPYGKVSDKYTLTPKLWNYLQQYATKHRAKGNGFGFGLFGPHDVARTLSARYYKDGSEILIKQEGTRPRRLTPRECARIMGFDNQYLNFRIPVSDTQAYRQFGNAVVVPVVKAIANHMLPFLLGEKVSTSPKQLELNYSEY